METKQAFRLALLAVFVFGAANFVLQLSGASLAAETDYLSQKGAL